MMWRGLLLALLAWAPTAAQIAWTPIYVDGSSEVDLWTQSVSGCACPWDNTRRDCACCVKEGACPCGKDNPARCTQCGLEAHCASMCNMTIDARALRNKSGRTFGQIKPPAFEGPVKCSYVLKPTAGQRVEIQLYRMLAVGHHNGTRCIGGALRLDTIELCGANERYSPPVVLFSDHGDTTLVLEIVERTARSQFLAYYSFTSLSNSQGVGFQPKGGNRIHQNVSDCDWLYQDVGCRGHGSCVAASPGYPGLYPPRIKCRYLFATSSIHTIVKLNFTAILFPKNRCSTDYLALYQGSSSNDPQLAKVCEQKTTLLEFPGPNLLLEFSSGNHVTPYNYNGFVATVEFLERPPTTTAPEALSANTSYLPQWGFVPSSSTAEFGRTNKCENTIWAEKNGRTGHFDTRSLGWHPDCRITFRGKHTDVVQISIFNYKLRAPSCRTVIEIVDGEWTSMPVSGNSYNEKQLLKLCSPAIRLARDEGGKFITHRSMVSKGSTLTLVLRRSTHSPSHSINPDAEFLDGAYKFHDEQMAGTPQPGGLCEAQYYGMSSAPAGLLSSPVNELFWNVEGRLECRYNFVPAANQSIMITIQELGIISNDKPCITECGDSGCLCRLTYTSLDEVDHLLLLTETGQPAVCLCGNFRSEWLPVSLRSWSSVQLVYYVAHYTWPKKGFSFSASYQFNDDALCGHHTVTTHSGEIYSKELSSSGSISNFYHQHCTWILDSNVERQLVIDINTNQSRSCGAWNITIHEYSAMAEDQHHVGTLLHKFCPRDTYKKFTLPWRLNTVVVRVLAMTRKAPVYHVKWRSKAAVGGPAPAAAAFGNPQFKPLETLFPFTTLILITTTILS